MFPGFEDTPLISSHPIGIRGVVFEQHRVQAARMAAAPRAHTQLDLHVGPPQAIEIQDDAGAWKRGAASAGSITVTPAGQPYRVRWEGERELLIFAIDLAVCRQFLPEMLPRADFTVRAVANGDDPQLFHLARAFQAEAEAGCPAGRIYADSIAAAFVASFVDRYVTRPAEPDFTGLSRERLRQVTDHVQEHLDEDLSLAALAELARTSPFHFARQFKRSTGVTPHQYVVQRRLDKAQRLLENEALSIAEVAYATGFPSQAHFTAVFRRTFGVTPGAWRSEHRSKN
jgi:AraC family transcriptional regulator